MKTLLQINTSLFGERGESSRLADRFVSNWRDQHTDVRVIHRDLAASPVPHLTAERFKAFLAKPEERTPEQQAAAQASDELIDELERADVIVLAAPMYNFSVPSTLKAYFDHIARAGITFKYTDKGPVGLLQGKKAYVISTRGGVYADATRDTETAYVRQFLGFLGIDDVEFVYAEGLALGDAQKQGAIAQAQRQIEAINAPAIAYAA